MPNPQASAPQPGGAGAAPQGAGDPLQKFLADAVMTLKGVGAKNKVIQPEMDQMATIAAQALQKVSQAAGGPPQQAPAPPQQ